ncbi:MAG: stage IV sporulation protein A [Clostridiales bacterium]|nr:stage IV sporulation protein A [Clostridiales bacterium]
MEEYDVYKDIAERTGGDIYIGVVGPVRSGKSTFITNFMNAFVLPQTTGYELERMRDELPQSAEGRTVMTTQPKFVPSEAATINLSDTAKISVRLVDCVGYMVDGANGHMEGDAPRLVNTPWNDDPIPFERAAEIGTKKVITDHSSIGVVMTCDGSIKTELPRESYVSAEERTVAELKAIGKPFIIVLNSAVPDSPETHKIADGLAEKYNCAVMPLNVANLTKDDVVKLFETVLYEFPVRDVYMSSSSWIKALDSSSEISSELIKLTTALASKVERMRDCTAPIDISDGECEFFDGFELDKVELDKGRAIFKVKEKEGLFYRALKDACGLDIKDEFDLMSSIGDLVKAKRAYDKMEAALNQVAETGYGVVTPTLGEMTLNDPVVFKQGSRFGVKLKASAPSLHIMRVDIETEVCPVVGTEQQSEELVNYLLSEFEQNPKDIWQTNMFGKSLESLVNEGLNNKLNAMPTETQKKMRKTLSRIINEGRGGIICILL